MGRTRVLRAIAGVLLCLAPLGCATDSDEDDRGSGSCAGMCENFEHSGCLTSPNCAENCEQGRLASPASCDSAWNDFLGCASQAQILCDSSMEATLVGCDSEARALNACDGSGDDCESAGGGVGQTTVNGQQVSYTLEIVCDACPLYAGAPSGAACAVASDCADLCCDCDGITFSTRACIAGVCGTVAQVCDSTPGACTSFH